MELISMALFFLMHFGEIKLPPVPPPTTIEKPVAKPRVTTAKKNVNRKLAYNCVLFARSQNPSLPRGLFTKSSKAKIAQDIPPEEGSVILTKEGRYGHAGIVKEVKENSIVIEECNYNRGKCGTREIMKDNANILGYYPS
jgi:hypothetical protein